MSHDHSHDHPHEALADSADRLTYYQVMEIAVRELLQEKGIFTPADVRHQIEDMDGRHAGQGARMVARAWLDAEYKKRMIEDGTQAAEEIGIQVGPLKLVVVENTEQVHNVIVCTLCSCYPRVLLGLPPDWYKSRNYRSRVVRAPREVLKEFGTDIADQVTIRVHDSTADMRYLVLPLRPQGTDGWSEEKLAELVTRDSMIGTAIAEPPRSN